MKTDIFLANMAGILDAADANIETVLHVLETGQKTINKHNAEKLSVPPAFFEQLQMARDSLQTVTNWLIDNK